MISLLRLDRVGCDQFLSWRLPHIRVHVHVDDVLPRREPRLPGEVVGGASTGSGRRMW